MNAVARYIGLLLTGVLLSGCTEQVDVLFYPDKDDHRNVRTVKNVGTVDRCQERAVQLARSIGDENLRMSTFSCGLGAVDDPTFGRRYTHQVHPGWPEIEEPEPDRNSGTQAAPSPLDEARLETDSATAVEVQPYAFLDSFHNYDQARRFQMIAQERFKTILGNEQIIVALTNPGGQDFIFQVQIQGFEDLGEANGFCRSIMLSGQTCRTFTP